ncbi:hypothetical protein [Arcanobacterium hippocoleae]|uniref:hypothetical protein n=1 Tax=Arcanobacterium hippocoleae TaxID=149017 RepID=UPI00333EB477
MPQIRAKAEANIAQSGSEIAAFTRCAGIKRIATQLKSNKEYRARYYCARVENDSTGSHAC